MGSPTSQDDAMLQSGVPDSGQQQPNLDSLWSMGSTDQIADAITEHEGTQAGSVSSRNNNPGNLMYQKQDEADPAQVGNQTFAQFPSPETGRAALIKQLELDKSRPEYANMTPEQYIQAKYSPDGAPGNAPGQSAAYGQAIRDYLMLTSGRTNDEDMLRSGAVDKPETRPNSPEEAETAPEPSFLSKAVTAAKTGLRLAHKLGQTEIIKNAGDKLEAAYAEMFLNPLSDPDIAKLEGKPQVSMEEMRKEFPHLGAVKGVGDFLGSMSTPENLAILASMPALKGVALVKALVEGGFAVQMGVGATQQYADLKANWDQMDKAQKYEELTKLFLGTATAGAATLGAAHEGGAAVRKFHGAIVPEHIKAQLDAEKNQGKNQGQTQFRGGTDVPVLPEGMKARAAIARQPEMAQEHVRTQTAPVLAERLSAILAEAGGVKDSPDNAGTIEDPMNLEHMVNEREGTYQPAVRRIDEWSDGAYSKSQKRAKEAWTKKDFDALGDEHDVQDGLWDQHEAQLTSEGHDVPAARKAWRQARGYEKASQILKAATEVSATDDTQFDFKSGSSFATAIRRLLQDPSKPLDKIGVDAEAKNQMKDLARVLNEQRKAAAGKPTRFGNLVSSIGARIVIDAFGEVIGNQLFGTAGTVLGVPMAEGTRAAYSHLMDWWSKRFLSKALMTPEAVKTLKNGIELGADPDEILKKMNTQIHSADPTWYEKAAESLSGVWAKLTKGGEKGAVGPTGRGALGARAPFGAPQDVESEGRALPGTLPVTHPDYDWRTKQEGADVGEDARKKVEEKTGPLPRGERRIVPRTEDEQRTQELFAQARKELGEQASSDQIMDRVKELKSPASSREAGGSGTEEGAARDTNNVAQARKENPNGTHREWLSRALELTRQQLMGDRGEAEIPLTSPSGEILRGDVKAEGAREKDGEDQLVNPPYSEERPLLASHYSDQEGLESLDPEKFGTGKAGEESKRAKEPGFLKRTYLAASGYKERRVTNQAHRYDVSLDGRHYYDIRKDPQGIWKAGLQEGDGNSAQTNAERAIQAAGYKGYQADGVIASFEPIKTAGEDLPHQIAAYHNNNRGFTYNPAKGFMRDQPVFSVAGRYPDLEKTIPGQNISREAVKSYMEDPRVQAALAADPRNSVGGWFDGGNSQLEISKVFDNKDEAIKAGVDLNQKAIFDHSTRKEIATGGTGESPYAYKPAERVGGRKPTSKKVETGHDPDKNLGMDVVKQAGADRPEYLDNLATTVGQYDAVPNMPGAEDLEAAGEKADPQSVLDHFTNFLADNYEHIYNAMPEAIKKQALKWYDTVHNLTKDLANQYGKAHRQVAAMTAALSPQNPWNNNISSVFRVLDFLKNKQDFKYDRAMTDRVVDFTGASEDIDHYLAQIHLKRFSQLKGDPNIPDDLLYKQAMWIQLYDAAHNPQHYEIFSPDGKSAGMATNDDGQPTAFVWFGLNPLAKAISIYNDGSMENIHQRLGTAHKVRNFYNNIADPQGAGSTVDTHSVAAGHLSPLGTKDPEVLNNFYSSSGAKGQFGGKVGNAQYGLKGTYPLYDEGHTIAAKRVGLRPNQLQSITWEGIRSLFPDKKNKEINQAVADAWKDHKDGKITANQARDRIIKAAGGFKPPDWATDEERRSIAEHNARKGYTPNTGELPQPELHGETPEATSPRDGTGDARGVEGSGQLASAAAAGQEVAPLEQARAKSNFKSTARAAAARLKGESGSLKIPFTGTEQEDAPTFYSKAERVAQEKLPNAATADQVLSTLKNNGVKDSELDWMGLPEWLKGQGKVLKGALQQFINQNQIQLKDVTYGDERVDEMKALNDQRRKVYARNNADGAEIYHKDWGYALIQAVKNPHESSFANSGLDAAMIGIPENERNIAERYYNSARELDDLDHKIAVLDRQMDAIKQPKFESWALKGPKTNYGEKLMELQPKPDPKPPEDQTIDNAAQALYGKPFYRLSKVEAKVVWEAMQSGKAAGPSRQEFKVPAHWDQEPNIVAHVRYSDRPQEDGKKTLFMEEAQSDWAQQGHAKGFQGEEAKNLTWRSNGRTAFGQREGWAWFRGDTQVSGAFPSETDKENARATISSRSAAVPDMPFKNNWHELAMKKMIRMAAEKGYDRLAWTTGQQQADRYNLAKHVDHLEYHPERHILKGSTINGHRVFDKQLDNDNDLAEQIGKDAANKLLATPVKNGWHSLGNADLEVGGEFHKQLYDKKIPSFVEKYIKKWGGKVGESKITTGEQDVRDYDGPPISREGLELESERLDNGYLRGTISQVIVDMKLGMSFRDAMLKSGSESLAEFLGGKFVQNKETHNEKVHSIEITPEMKRSVLKEGQPIAKAASPKRPTVDSKLSDLYAGISA